MIGKNLSHYKILEELGRGGMGIVYKAEDTKLDRTVAIKVLPSAALGSEDDRVRFYREAKAAAQLHHPHIASVFEIDEAVPEGSKDDDLRPFIAMEFIEGKTLDAKIKEGPFKLEDAVRIASEIASALEAAHKKDIVHRDIKSQNVMLTEEGSAKVLDFGLAQTAQSTKLTRMGSTLGTIAYMSPEQARSEEVDRRTDIWSLGVVLYEMVAGKNPFPGDYEQAAVYSILNEDPEPLTAIRTGVPMGVEWIVSKCLAKKADARYQNATDLLVDLRNVDLVASGMLSVSATMPLAPDIAPPARRKHTVLLTLLAGLILGGVVTSGAIWNLSGSDTPPPLTSRLTITVPSEQSLRQGKDLPFAVSPGGRRLVMVVDHVDRPSQLYLRSLDDFAAAPLPGTEDGTQPFFSPDGQWVGFWANGVLYKVSVKEGGAIKVSDIPLGFRGASWGPDDTIILGGMNRGLSRISAGGGPPVEITNLESDMRGSPNHERPHLLPGGRDVLFQIYPEGTSEIVILSLETGQWQILPELRGGKQPRYIDSGHLVFARGRDLFAIRFDSQARTTVGSSTPVLSGVNTRFNAGVELVDFDISRTGSLVYLPSAKRENELVFVDRDGGQNPLPMDAGNLLNRPAIAPDGKNIAIYFNPDFAGSNVWIKNLERGTFSPLTTGAPNIYPLWTPDGSRVTFASISSGSFNLHWQQADGSAEAEPLLTRDYGQFPGSWSPDGEILTFRESNPNSGSDIWMLHRDSVQAPQPLVVTPFNEGSPAISYDGHWLAYESDASGRYEVYVQPFPGPGRRSPISTNGGQEPVWSPDGNELFYHTDDSMMVVTIEVDPEFNSSAPRSLFAWRFNNAGTGDEYSVTPDGTQFIMVRVNQEAFDEVNVILNWSKELERLVPTDQ